MRIKSQRDFWAGLMFLLIGIGFAIGARTYTMGDSARPGPGYFPFGLGVLLALIGAFVLFEALTVETDDGEPVGKFAWRPIIVITLSVVLYGLTLPKLGLVVAVPLLVLVSSFASDEFSWLAAVINAAVLTVFAWLVFVKGLGLTIPVLPSFGAGG
jgi:Tripartite tricarboxylate transporter TctB family